MDKKLNSKFGPAELLREEIAAFLGGCEGSASDLAEYRQSANWLAGLVVHPERMKDDGWFAKFYEAHPRFTLEFMLSMRRSLASKSTAEKWLHSSDGMSRQKEKDSAISADLGLGVKSTQLRNARAKLRPQSLPKNPNMKELRAKASRLPEALRRNKKLP